MDGDTYKAAIEKVRTGITAQTNQAMVRFKLMIEMSQSGRVFSEWRPKVKEQAVGCVWNGYDAKMAARDALLHCNYPLLQLLIITLLMQ